MLYWFLYSNKFNGKFIYNIFDTRFLRISSMLVFTLLLLLQLKYSVDASLKELKYPASNSKEFARFINENDQFKNAIIMGEPDVILESIPYYIDNKIYFPREKRFGRRANYTIARNPKLTLNELLDDAKFLHETYDEAPVLILIYKQIDKNTEFTEERNGWGATFELDSCSVRNFLENAILLKSFRGSLTGEDYDVYLFKP